MATNQKEIFLQSEGDAWFNRNKEATSKRGIDDVIVEAITKLPSLGTGSTILEVGSGGGERLALLQEKLGFKCIGIEPGVKAVENARSLGVESIQGTADRLVFPDASFDVVIFGFCLYLCDRGDLFRIASEADRVLKPKGWIVIHDFFSERPFAREYHHRPGILSHKMDYRELFTWHPMYTCFKHELAGHSDSRYTDDQQEWVSLSILRKNDTLADQ